MTPKAKRLLAWLNDVRDGCLLEQQVIGSGLSAALNELLRGGYVTLDNHPTVRTRPAGGAPGMPATGVFLLEKGRMPK